MELKLEFTAKTAIFKARHAGCGTGQTRANVRQERLLSENLTIESQIYVFDGKIST